VVLGFDWRQASFDTNGKGFLRLRKQADARISGRCLFVLLICSLKGWVFLIKAIQARKLRAAECRPYKMQ